MFLAKRAEHSPRTCQEAKRPHSLADWIFSSGRWQRVSRYWVFGRRNDHFSASVRCTSSAGSDQEPCQANSHFNLVSTLQLYHASRSQARQSYAGTGWNSENNRFWNGKVVWRWNLAQLKSHHTLLQASGNSFRRKVLRTRFRHVVCRLHHSRNNNAQTTVPRRKPAWLAVENLRNPRHTRCKPLRLKLV